MEIELFILLIALAAVIYSIITRFIQMKFGNQKEMQEIQKETKRLGDEYKKALDRGDKTRADELMNAQMQQLQKMNTMMFSQLKTMLPIIAVFLLFTTVINYFDPTVKDDLTIELLDDGKNCDKVAGDGIYSTCTKAGEKAGLWNVHSKIQTNDEVVAENSSFFFVEKKDGYEYVKQNGPGLLDGILGKKFPSNSVTTDKQEYSKGETVGVYLESSIAGKAAAVIDSGTVFTFTIPLLGISIHEANWAFILITFISGFAVSWIHGKMKKEDKK